ncbi:Nn.00g117700.m01.CDS01 [Neocucurbitaria sp. VM-36]
MPYNNTPIAPSKEVTGHVSLPLARVQKIIQADPERINTSKNAAFAIALATEMFIQHLATTTHNVVKAERKPRRNIQYRDVSSAVSKTDNLEFLVDVVPKTTTYKDFKKRVEEKERAKGKEKEKEGKPTEKKEVVAANGVASEQDTLGASGSGSLEEEVKQVLNGGSMGRSLLNGNGGGASFMTPEKAEKTPDAMDLDHEPVPEPQLEPERVEDSEPEEDAAAMQIEMEMRGPPRPVPSASPEIRRSSGFTAINGSR